MMEVLRKSTAASGPPDVAAPQVPIYAAPGGATPVVLTLGRHMDAGDEAALKAGGLHVMPCCDPMIALGWLVEHEGFFDCVVVGPDLAGDEDVLRLLVGASAADLEVPVLIRTAFPLAEGELSDIRVSDIYPEARRIPAGLSALEAALREMFQDAGVDAWPASAALCAGYAGQNEGRTGGSPRFLVLHLLLVSLGTTLGGVLAATLVLIAGETFWNGVSLYVLGAGLGCIASITALRLGAWRRLETREGRA